MLPDEGRYAGIAWEMLRSGDWLTPTLNGLPFFHKPPLFYWITASAMGLFGNGELAARAAPLVGSTLGALSLYLFMRRWLGERSARLGTIALLVQPLFFIGGQFANLDMLVAGCIGATITLLAHSALCMEHGLPWRRPLAVAFAMAALGVLAKGLIGAVLPGMVIVLWLLARGQWRVMLRLLWPPGIALFLLLAAPWFLLMQQRFDGFLHYFFVVQHFQRFTQGGFNNAQPVWFYAAVLAVFSLPFLPWLAQLFRRKKRADATTTSAGTGTGGNTSTPGVQREVASLMWIWLLAVLAFFSIPNSKLLGYILPVLPPLACLMALGLAALPQAGVRAVRLWYASVTVSALVSLGAVAALVFHTPETWHDMAAVMRAQRQSGEPVLMLGHYYYDLPLYAHLTEPTRVVDNWNDPSLRQTDNWRKELVDAGDFLPVQAQALMIQPGELQAALCLAPVNWVVATHDAMRDYPFLVRSEALFDARGSMLWRVRTGQPEVAQALHCAGKPNGG
ncbi:glycosyltransferase family 39 protein [soil metagenome]